VTLDVAAPARWQIPLLEKGRSKVLPDMNERTNEDVFDLRSEKNIMRLEAEAAVTGHKFVGADSDARKISEEPKRTLEACVIGICLISSECGLGLGVNIEKIAAHSKRKTIFSHGTIRRGHAPEQEHHASCRSSECRNRGG
jgi:hypothetical protein